MRALRRSSTATATVAAAGQVTASARMPPPVRPCRRRAGRRPRTVATVAPRGTSVQSAMRALRSSSTAAATVAAAGRATASARTLLAVFHSRRRSGRRPRTVATAAPSGTPSQGAMHALRGSTSAAATVAAPALATAGARTPPPIFPRSRRDGPARYFGRAPAHRGTPGQVRRSRCARSPMAAATGAAPNPGTAPPPTAFSILFAPSHRRAVAPSTKSAHRGRFPTYPPVPALHPFSTTNTVVENGARPTLLRCRSIAASVRTRGYVENLRGITTARAPNFQPDMHCLRSTPSLPICRTEDGSTCAFICCFFSLCFRLCDAGKPPLCFNQANASAATKSHFGWLR